MVEADSDKWTQTYIRQTETDRDRDRDKGKHRQMKTYRDRNKDRKRQPVKDRDRLKQILTTNKQQDVAFVSVSVCFCLSDV